MNDKGFEKDCEELSALMDGEISELELRRILKKTEQEPALAQKWSDLQLAASVLRSETHGCAERWASVDLSARVAEALADESAPALVEESDAIEQKKTKPLWYRPLANVAVAASVSVMVVAGWQNFNRPAVQAGAGAGVDVASNTAAPSQVMTPRSGQGTLPVQASSASSHLMPVSQGSLVSPLNRTAVPQQEVIRYNPNVDDRLNYYLISHSNNAAVNTAGGMTSYARVVNIKPKEDASEKGPQMEK